MSTSCNVCLSCVDLWRVILSHLSFADVCRIRATCRTFFEHCRTHDYHIALCYARTTMGDPDFWARALLRPKTHSKPLRSWHEEILRIERFRSSTGLQFRAIDFYELWKVLDLIPLSTLREKKREQDSQSRSTQV